MPVDDHAIDALKVWFRIEIELLINEFESGEYEKLSDCPSYKGCKAYREALNVLIKGCYLPQYYDSFKMASIKEEMDFVKRGF